MKNKVVHLDTVFDPFIKKRVAVRRATPKTLLEALSNALRPFGVAPDGVMVHHTEASVKDFLSQRFQAAMFENAGTKTEEVLMDLWERIKQEK